MTNLFIAIGVILLIFVLIDIYKTVRNPNHRRVGWKERLGFGRSECELCKGSGEVIVRSSRLMGATYWGSERGDEHLEECPQCSLL